MTRLLRNAVQTLVQGIRGFMIEVAALIALFVVAALIALAFTQLL